ncbi:AraC family transcriptional regulator [Novosphingobium sp. KCTC 2891]|uniref:helix-turn-helix domain-containing protein n=1 Tax=Novosphingobium sp. KCTC 2891 TaxID=2989730 RepID=UPI002221D7FD|nr:AraC family transcriptional regulator [Novosphingobium sp. KCTC 2891]MCW1385021.1 AraC family transcriptional regulator [Novosphingobium sp. KCTC 2891]
MEQVFSSTRVSSAEAFQAYAAVARREFYDGDLKCLDDNFSNVEMEKALSSPVSITRICSSSDLSYRRGTQHIRNNRVGLRVIWFARKGAIKIVRANGTCEIAAGSAGILDSSAPFQATLRRNGEDRHESIQIIVPPDMFLMHLQEAERLFTPFDLQSAEGMAALRLLDVILDYGDRLGDHAARHLVGGLLESIADHLRSSKMEMPRRQKLVDRRLADIENYIMMNLTDPDLSYDKVAANCGISPRYLCYLLKANNTSFSELVWKNRLPKARDWLLSPKTRDHPIHEIAYMSGFKSAAHFSRMFKAAYGIPPREFRTRHMKGTMQDRAARDEGSARHAA